MLLALPQFSLEKFIYIFGLSTFIYCVGNLLNNRLVNKIYLRKLIVSVIIIFLIITLSFFKYSLIQKIFYLHILDRTFIASNFLFIIGISYSSFKMIHFIIESYNKKLSNLTYLNYLNYIFYFPAFISGPINRYNHFCEQFNIIKINSFKNDFKVGSQRIVHGLFKKLVLATIVYPYSIINIHKSLGEMNGNELILGLYAYTFYFYFDFSGYSDIAIGTAQILGITLPENFNNPLFKKNIQQLWANWHISLTSWLTDYIYWPLSKKFRSSNILKKHPILLSNISIIITFLVCGIWHGESINFVIWGLYHGMGLAILNIYQKLKRKIRNRFLKAYFLSIYSQFVGAVVTFNFFAFGIIFFSSNIENIKILILRIF